MPIQHFVRSNSIDQQMASTYSPNTHLDESGGSSNDKRLAALHDSADGFEDYNVACFLFLLITIFAFLVKALME